MISKSLLRIFLSILCLQNSLHSENPDGYAPLYAGTMLAFFPTNVDPGRLALQPYLFATRQPGSYGKNWSFQQQKTINEFSMLLLAETGITRCMDITLLLSATYNWIGHRDSILYKDSSALLGFQILRDQKESWTPDFRLLLGESFPTGKYDHLNPQKMLSDSSGSGSYETSFIAVIRKIFYAFPKHPFNLNLNLVYTLAAPTDVAGFNIYGGAANTRGKVNPGNEFLTNLAIEYSLTRNWVLGMDLRYLHQDQSTFSGKRGSLPDDAIPSVGLPSSEQFSLAPCLEYNWTENLGILGGAWFTIAGRNAYNFLSGIISVYYEF